MGSIACTAGMGPDKWDMGIGMDHRDRCGDPVSRKRKASRIQRSSHVSSKGPSVSHVSDLAQMATNSALKSRV
jgi:hypothetical protein